MSQTKEPLLIVMPEIINSYGKVVKQRDRCGICKRPTVTATVDRGKTPRSKEQRTVGRPKKGLRYTRRKIIGRYCPRCDLFYYPNRSPNYRMRLGI